jgi:hypothetical protein
MTRCLAAALALALCAALVPGTASAQALVDRCVAQTCKARLTGPELLAEIQKLVDAKRYDDAKPLLAALSAAPQYGFETRFLTGFIAEQTGDYVHAVNIFRDMLTADPGQTRVRLELARTYLAMGRPQSADKQFRLAQQDDELPPDIARAIRSVRDTIRSRRAWSVNVDFGIAPDSNINSATSANTINVLFGNQPIPVTLNQNAKARSGTGITGTIDAGARLPIAKDWSLVADFNASGADYKGVDYDDYSFELAAGPEYRLSSASRLRVQGVGAERLYGGKIASQQIGVKLGFDTNITRSQRIGIQIDARRTDAHFDHNYDGWQIGAYATYERAIAKSLVASGSVYVRRDELRVAPYSDTEIGMMLGVGGELPKGFNVGLSGGISRARYDAPVPLFSLDPRGDWRYNARLAVGNRAIRVWGFSPSVSVSYGRIDSTLPFYASSRTRFRFALARYF